MSELKHSNAAMPPGAPSLARYPPDPMRLPSSHLQASYPDGLPAKKELNGLATLMQHHIFVRSNGKLLQDYVGLCGIFTRFFCLSRIAALHSTKPLSPKQKPSSFVARFPATKMKPSFSS